ncbi:MAG: hypothetical protein CVV47_07135 [Spirochaetae bacterium HGW-Spirochaetae-3]|jgi:diguanylate cyclase (GGDEF)-like protein|nr:MAG: hypothetical protein CVV47_07135 [Spirochaetae bacterium HGW-Spirochaetae-3]
MEELPKTGIGEKGRLVATIIILLVVGFSAVIVLTSRATAASGLVAGAIIASVSIALSAAAAGAALDRFQNRLERTASHDQLTGALNCMAFSVLCDHAVKESRRNGTPLSVALFDIDDFNRVNAEFGKKAGDKVLRLIAAGGQSGLRQCDPLCRWGGDEFIALLASCDTDGALAAADKFRTSASDLCAVEGPSGVTISAGVATMRPDESFYSLVGRADESLASAKRKGKAATVVAEG